MESEIERNLNKFINQTIGKAVNAGIERVVQLVENTAKRECPVDLGPLRADIRHEVDKAEYEGIVGNNEGYAPYVHEGTGIYTVNGNGRQNVPWTYRGADGKYHTTQGQKPNPYLQRAIDENRGIMLRVLGEGAATEWKR